MHRIFFYHKELKDLGSIDLDGCFDVNQHLKLFFKILSIKNKPKNSRPKEEVKKCNWFKEHDAAFAKHRYFQGI